MNTMNIYCYCGIQRLVSVHCLEDAKCPFVGLTLTVKKKLRHACIQKVRQMQFMRISTSTHCLQPKCNALLKFAPQKSAKEVE